MFIYKRNFWRKNKYKTQVNFAGNQARRQATPQTTKTCRSAKGQVAKSPSRQATLNTGDSKMPAEESSRIAHARQRTRTLVRRLRHSKRVTQRSQQSTKTRRKNVTSVQIS